MNDLSAIIAEEARSHGAMTFARFMQLALYCPNSGYYDRPETTVGRSGDFYTSVSVGSLFGQLLAFQFAEWLDALSSPLGLNAPRSSTQIVESGAHDGRLAGDILGWLHSKLPKLLDTLEYWIIEPSSARTRAQKQTLSEFAASVRWFPEWNAIPAAGVNGIIFSNELLDAMPVHRIGWDASEKEWFEWGVTIRPGDHDFIWTRLPAGPDLLARGLPDLPGHLLDVLPDGFTTEVGLAAIDWWSQAASALRSGRLLTIDYGLAAEEFFLPERNQGTLRAYHRHRMSSDLLARPGEQDLTAHVNFTAIQSAGESRGLHTDTLQTQAQFLTSILQQFEPGRSRFGDWTPKLARQFQTLTHPSHLGRPFRVLVQSRMTAVPRTGSHS